MPHRACSLALAGALALAAPAFGEPAGCFTRTYSDAHLADHPDQVVAAIWVNFTRHVEFGELLASLAVVTSDGGHVAASGQTDSYFGQGLYCYPDQDPMTCSVDCDGGWFKLTRDTGDMIEITTSYLTVGDYEGCGGSVDIAERPGEPVVYRLYRADPAACETN